MSSTTTPIRPLPEQLISQIAAGEVIERPASVVKELLENALDAGASRIEIDIEQGGRRLIRITDNGHGIAREQLVLALQRHATSKIHRLDDLVTVSSLGFRGEALASIASISRLLLASRPPAAVSGWVLEAGDRVAIDPPRPLAMPVGTLVEVRDLFFNTPARRKFLRSDRTEFQHIQDLVRRLALSRPGVALSLSHGGRKVLRLSAAAQPAALTRRLERIFGQGFQARAVAVQASAGTLDLKGWFGMPELARSQSDLQFFTINGRIIRDRHVLHAIRMACEELMPEGRHPCYLLDLEMDPQDADMNVHPAKAEVRFRDPRQVHDFIVSALRRVLRPDLVVAAETVRASMDTVSLPATASPSAPRPLPPRPAGSTTRTTGTAEAWAVYRAAPAASGDRSPATEPLGVLDSRYLLAQQGESLLLIDAVLASRELLRRQLQAARDAGGLRSRPLLIPEAVSLSAPAALLAQSASLARLGVEISPAGPDSVLLRTLPTPLAGADARSLIMALADMLQASATPREEDLIRALARHGRLPWDWQHGRDMAPLLAALTDAGLLQGKVPGLCRSLDGKALAVLLAGPSGNGKLV